MTSYSSLASEIKDIINRSLLQGVFPGGVIALGDPLAEPQIIAFGKVGLTRDLRAVSPQTVYDLASVTKLVATTHLLMLALKSGPLACTTSLASLGFKCPPLTSCLTLEELLSHQSGLPAWRPLYHAKMSTLAERKERALADILAEPLLFTPKDRSLYSDLGFILLGEILEANYKSTLPSLFSQKIAIPLALTSSFYSPRFNPLMDTFPFPPDLAPTEDGGRKPGPLNYPGLGSYGPVPWGSPHDDNCSYLNGAAGHAGLFSTAHDLWKILRSFAASLIEDSSFLPKELMKDFLSPRVAKDGSERALGFNIFPLASGRKILGHLGYTGTSLYWDPELCRGLILLTNRCHPTSRNHLIDDFRKTLVDIIFNK
ncbi:MAG: beta-lactamase family protein [Deltaproteobacteria bacterium]|jgi:CubicO group peptidase (beta-lactamase class C family)|nr:beta-lactamase family protein [Deltaproteobacteria bacterium]